MEAKFKSDLRIKWKIKHLISRINFKMQQQVLSLNFSLNGCPLSHALSLEEKKLKKQTRVKDLWICNRKIDNLQLFTTTTG